MNLRQLEQYIFKVNELENQASRLNEEIKNLVVKLEQEKEKYLDLDMAHR